MDESWKPIKGDMSMANRLTTYGIKDGVFKKKENDGNRKRTSQRQYADQHMKCAKCNFHHSGNCPVCGRCKQVGHFTRYCTSRVANERPRPTCYECRDPNHFRSYPRMNQATTSGGNCPNPVLAIEGNHNQGNNRNQTRGRAFVIGAAEAPQDSNIVTGTFYLSAHFATVLFDSDVDYSFISTNFLPLIDMKTSVISLGYEIKIANSLKVETNKIVRGCRLELEVHTFIIDLIPFGHGRFDVIVGMDWLSKLKAKIVCYEKIVQISLSNREILEVHGERPEENLKRLNTMKVNEQKLEDIPIVRNFPGLFLKDLSGLPPSREIEFLIDLIPGAMPVSKSPYRLAPTEMQELSNQLKELQDKGFIQLSSSPWGAPVLFVKKKDGSFRLHTVEEIESDGFKAYWDASLRVIASKDELVDYWTWISSNGDFLGTTPSYTLIREPLRRLFHRLIMLPSLVGVINLRREEAGSSDVWRSLYYMTGCYELGRDGSTEAVGEQHELLERISNDQARFSTRMVGRMTKLIEQSGMRYVRFDGTNIRDSQLEYNRCRVKPRTDDTSTLAAQQTPPQPDA
nr:putative reverse transcriptase domain-containing protein [Tanacetum cinerariifolium]